MILGATSLYLLASRLIPGPLEDLDLPANIRVENPTGVAGLKTIADALAGLGTLVILVAAAAAVPSILLRYRRSRGEERQQIRWLAYVTATFISIVIVGIATALAMGSSFDNSAISDFFFIAGFAVVGIGVPIAIGVSVLRYRLYDLHIVVKKTVVFGVLVTLLLVLGFLMALVVGGSVVGLTTDTAPLIVGAILGLCVLPLYRIATKLADRLVYGGRANPYGVLTEFSGRVAETYSADDVLPRTAAVLGPAIGARVVRIWLRVGDGFRQAASWPADVAASIVESHSGDSLPTFEGEDAFEVRHQGELLGAITVGMPANDPMNPSKQRLVRDLASQEGLVLRNVRLIQDLRDSRRRIVAAQDERAKKLERDIHDGAQQQLVALAVKLRLLEQTIDREALKARAMAAQLGSAATEALEDLRDLARGIYPPLLADQGLGAALAAQVRKGAMPVTVSADGIGRFGADVESAVYFSCLEALQNAAKYSQARQVSVRLSDGAGELRFEVRDDGRGFDPATTAYGTGLMGIADRLAALGGELVVTSAPGDGTSGAGRQPVVRAGAPCNGAPAGAIVAVSVASHIVAAWLGWLALFAGSSSDVRRDQMRGERKPIPLSPARVRERDLLREATRVTRRSRSLRVPDVATAIERRAVCFTPDHVGHPRRAHRDPKVITVGEGVSVRTLVRSSEPEVREPNVRPRHRPAILTPHVTTC